MSRHSVEQIQINCEIPAANFSLLSGHFDYVELLLDMMGLNNADKTNVRNDAKNDTQAGMMRCF